MSQNFSGFDGDRSAVHIPFPVPIPHILTLKLFSSDLPPPLSHFNIVLIRASTFHLAAALEAAAIPSPSPPTMQCLEQDVLGVVAEQAFSTPGESPFNPPPPQRRLPPLTPFLVSTGPPLQTRALQAAPPVFLHSSSLKRTMPRKMSLVSAARLSL
jgi:hypothetical protein